MQTFIKWKLYKKSLWALLWKGVEFTLFLIGYLFLKKYWNVELEKKCWAEPKFALEWLGKDF